LEYLASEEMESKLN